MNVAHRAAGDVMCLKVLGKHIVVLSSQAAASDLLDKRSAIYSSRPDFVLYKMYALLHIYPVERPLRSFIQGIIGRVALVLTI